MVPERLALPGRAEPIPSPATHFINGRPIKPPFPEGIETALFAMGIVLFLISFFFVGVIRVVTGKRVSR